MTGAKSTAPTPLRPAWAVYTGVFIILMVQTMVLTLLPVSVEASTALSGVALGLLLAASEGLGVVTAPPVAQWVDQHGPTRVLRVGGLIVAVSMATLALGLATSGPVAVIVAAVIAYALVRMALMASILSAVAALPNRLRALGINSATQRVAALLTAGLASLVVLTEQWAWGFWMCSAAGLALTLAAGRDPRPPRAPRDPAAAAFWKAYGTSLRMVRNDREIQASSLVVLANRVVMVSGSAFFVFSVEGDRVAAMLLLFLLVRDISAIVCGPVFRPLVLRIGVGATITVMGALGAAGLLLIGLGGDALTAIIAGAALQGASIGIAIALMNLLAMNRDQGGRALRVSSTFYIGAPSAMVIPVILGAVLDLAGGAAVFVAASAVVALVTCVTWALSRRVVLASSPAVENQERSDDIVPG